MHPTPDFSHLTPEQLRTLAADLLLQVQARDEIIAARDQTIVARDQALQHSNLRADKLTHELALLRRYRFGKASEGLDSQQQSLLEDLVREDIAALETELAQMTVPPKADTDKQQPKRQALPKELPRTEIRHEPDVTTCRCGCQLLRIGEDISEKLDYQPGVFTVEQHIRGKWACRQCETLVQVPMPAHVIDKGIPTSRLLAHVLVAKYADHLPLYRQEQIFARAGMQLPRSTLADWIGRCGVELQPLVDALRAELLTHTVLHADETPVAMLAPGKKQTHRAYVWAYATTRFASVQGVVYDFRPTRSGKEVRDFLADWQGKLVCDDFSGYKASFAQGVIEIGCMAHARRKFHELHIANKSQIARQALEYIRQLYEIERGAEQLAATERVKVRQAHAKPILDQLHQWLLAQRQLVTNGTATAKAIDYGLKRWAALIRYLDDGVVPIDNNWIENQIRPWALGRSNWLFAGSLRSGQRAAAIMSLIQSAKINGHDPYAYLKDVLERLPIQRASLIGELLPHNWKPADKV